MTVALGSRTQVSEQLFFTMVREMCCCDDLQERSQYVAMSLYTFSYVFVTEVFATQQLMQSSRSIY